MYKFPKRFPTAKGNVATEHTLVHIAIFVVVLLLPREESYREYRMVELLQHKSGVRSIKSHWWISLLFKKKHIQITVILNQNV